MTIPTDLLDEAIRLSAEADRPDLRRRLLQTRGRLRDPDTRVVVVGEFKQGKSKLVNALVNAPICPVDDDIATVVPTVVRYGDTPSAEVVVTDGEGIGPDEPPLVRREPIDVGDVARHVAERGNPGNHRDLTAVEVRLPRELLRGGLTLVDSPGVNGFRSVATLNAIAGADALLLVSDASRELIEPEVRFLRQAMHVCPNVACVVSKIDLTPDWRRIADLDRGHLRDVAPGVPVLPVSSELRLRAARDRDADLNAESGFPALVGYLRREVLGQADRMRQRSVAQDVLAVTEHLRLRLTSQLKVLLDPASTPEVLERMEEARRRSDELRQRSARWQVTLADGMADLIADLEHDLRDRMRAIGREAEDAIDAGDPGPVWADMSEWLEQRVGAAISDTFVWTSDRARWLAEEVAEQFAREDVPLPMLDVGATDDVLEPVEVVPLLDPGYVGTMEKFLIGMRGSYGGVLMVGLVTSILGMALINPLSIAAGVLIGTKAYHDDKAGRLRRRQAEAKALVRRQIDDVVFQVGKQLKDRLRQVQREVRDHFTALAEEHRRSVEDALKGAQAAAREFDVDRERRASRLRRELDRVERIRERAVALRDDRRPVAPERESPRPAPARIPAASA